MKGHSKVKEKLFFYIGSLEYGGAERVMSILCNCFSSNDYEVFLFLEKKSQKEYKLDNRIKKIYLKSASTSEKKRMSNLSRIVEIRKYIKMYKPAVMCSFLPGQNIRTIVATMGLNTRAYISVRTSPEMEYSNKCKRFIMQRICTLADGIIFQTNNAMEMYPKSARRNSYVIPNPIMDKCFDSVVKEGNNHSLVAVGRLEEVKNYEMMIDALSLVRTKIQDVKLEIWGDGKKRADIIKRIIDKDMEDTIVLKGSADDVSLIYKDASIYLLTSNYEGMPNSLMEAMAEGLAVVTTDCPPGGPKELINNGVNGILISCGSVMELSEAIVELCDDEKKRILLGKNAKTSAKKYKTDIVYLKWESVLLQHIKK